ncbi:hypothetical protein L6252_02310 [Candidatus Parcubacteria bacterium]|nr:hypothetical protein [Candidatus Parcubacteria bacterium]
MQGKPNNENKLITCEAVKNSRVLIMPNLEVYSCPLLLDTKRSFAYFKNGSFLYSPNYQKNIFQAKDIQGPVCPALWDEKKQQYLQDGIYPVCVSYKHSNKNL